MKKLDVQTDQKSKRLILIGHIWISLTSFDWFLSMTLMFLSFCCVDATHPPAGRGGQKAAQTGMLQGCQQSEESHKSLLSTKNFQHRPSISSIYPFPSILDPYSIHIPSIFHGYHPAGFPLKLSPRSRSLQCSLHQPCWRPATAHGARDEI